MHFKASFERKATEPDAVETDIIGVVELKENQFDFFSHNLLNDYDFIADFSREAYDDGERKHCLLVLGENREDGILVCAEGSFYARYSSYLPKARRIMEDEIQRIADYIIQGRFGDSGKGSWIIGWDDIKEHCDLTVTPTNGIGNMLIEELERREEVGEIIATEDCIEMTNFMVNCPEGMSAKDCLLTLFSMMGCNLENVFIIHEDDGHEGEPIAELNQSILTEEGKKDWADVLQAKVTRAYESGHGLHVEVTGCSVKRLRAFANAVNGHCSDEEWSRWFRNDSENTEGFTLGGQA